MSCLLSRGDFQHCTPSWGKRCTTVVHSYLFLSPRFLFSSIRFPRRLKSKLTPLLTSTTSILGTNQPFILTLTSCPHHTTPDHFHSPFIHSLTLYFSSHHKYTHLFPTTQTHSEQNRTMTTTQTHINIIILIAGFLTSILTILLIIFAIYKLRYAQHRDPHDDNNGENPAGQKGTAVSTAHNNENDDDNSADTPKKQFDHDALDMGSVSSSSVFPTETERSSTATLTLFRTDPDVFQSSDTAGLRFSEEFGSDLFDGRRSTTTATDRTKASSIAIPMNMDLGDGSTGEPTWGGGHFVGDFLYQQQHTRARRTIDCHWRSMLCCVISSHLLWVDAALSAALSRSKCSSTPFWISRKSVVGGIIHREMSSRLVQIFVFSRGLLFSSWCRRRTRKQSVDYSWFIECDHTFDDNKKEKCWESAPSEQLQWHIA